MKIASIIMAAGRGSRMKNYNGNKTLLPLIPGASDFEGSHPLLLHILDGLPKGPKCVIVNFKKEEVIRSTRGSGISYGEQPSLNGTGGALLAAREFIDCSSSHCVIVTMGDVPFVSGTTYLNLARTLNQNSLVILGFIPRDKKQYGILDISGDKVNRIIEWNYWKDWPPEKIDHYSVCNAGIYAFNQDILVRYLPILESSPHRVRKVINGEETEIEEFFITDLVEFMVKDGLSVGYVTTENETEAMGVDDLAALKQAQEWYKRDVGNR
jgi:bifunctional UDP-N-acetylglucosamine pyrophosphorylase / glucosamine-1-phosphate N-acetyltransferase